MLKSHFQTNWFNFDELINSVELFSMLVFYIQVMGTEIFNEGEQTGERQEWPMASPHD